MEPDMNKDPIHAATAIDNQAVKCIAVTYADADTKAAVSFPSRGGFRQDNFLFVENLKAKPRRVTPSGFTGNIE
ncbi:MAG: hypothetical protein ABI707_05385 [Ferruginibacter sp.]